MFIKQNQPELQFVCLFAWRLMALSALYRAIGVWNIYCVGPGRNRHTINEQDRQKIMFHGSAGIRTFRSLERKFSVGTFAPRNESSRELLLPGIFVPGNKCSREQMFPGTFVLGIVTSLSDHGSGCLCYSESKLKKYSKINANTYLYYCWLRLRTFAHC